MKIFIAANIKGPNDLLLHQKMVQELRGIGLSVITNLDIKNKSAEAPDFISLDALIIDGTSLDPENGYLLALALAHKKPVLYLLAKGSLIDQSVAALSQNPEVKKFIKISFYSTDSLIPKVKAFLQYLDENIGREAYTIKYTLRLSPRIDRFIDWKTKKTRKSKADFLRDLVDQMMKGDQEYTDRLK